MTRKLQDHDVERYEEIVRREMEIRRFACDQLREVAYDAQRLMDDISQREGLNTKEYAINWKEGTMTPRMK